MPTTTTRQLLVCVGAALALCTIGAKGGCLKRADLANTSDAGDGGGSTQPSDAVANDTSSDTSATTSPGGSDTTSETGLAGDTAVTDGSSHDSGRSRDGRSRDTGGTRADTRILDGGSDTGNPCQSDKHEPNDSASTSTAAAARLNVTELGWACRGDADWFDFSNVQSQGWDTTHSVELSVVHSDQSANLTVELWRKPSGGSLQRIATTRGTAINNIPNRTTSSGTIKTQNGKWYSIRHQVQSSGNGPYFIKISGANSPVQYAVAAYQRQYATSNQNCQPDQMEPNDSTSNATSVTLPPVGQAKSTRMQRLCPGDKDTLKFQVPAGHAVYMRPTYPLVGSMGLNVRTATGAKLKKDLWHHLYLGWDHYHFEVPAGSGSYTVYFTVKNRSFSPHVGVHNWMVIHKKSL